MKSESIYKTTDLDLAANLLARGATHPDDTPWQTVAGNHSQPVVEFAFTDVEPSWITDWRQGRDTVVCPNCGEPHSVQTLLQTFMACRRHLLRIIKDKMTKRNTK